MFPPIVILPLVVKSSIDKSPLAVKLPVTFIESLKSIAVPPLTDSKASARTVPLAVIFPATIKCPNEPVLSVAVKLLEKVTKLPDCGAIVFTFICDTLFYPYHCIKKEDGTTINFASSSIVKLTPSATVKLSPIISETLSPEKV